MIEFQGKFDENIIKKLNNRTLKRMMWFIGGLSVIIMLLGILGIVCREDVQDLFLGVYFIVFGAIFSPLVILLVKVLQNYHVKSFYIMSSETLQAFRFYPDKLEITQIKKCGNGEENEFEDNAVAKYSCFFKAEETKDAYFLFISRMQTFVIPKNDLKQGTIGDLNDLLSANLGRKFKRCK